MVVEAESGEALAVEEEPAGALAVEAESEEALAVEEEPEEALAAEKEPAGVLAVEAGAERVLAAEAEPKGVLAVETERERAFVVEAEQEKDILAEKSISEAVNPDSESIKQENPGTEAKPMKQEDPRTKTMSVTEPEPKEESVAALDPSKDTEFKWRAESAAGMDPIVTVQPKPVSEPATEELQISQAEPIAEELQKYEAEPLTEEMWIPKAGLAEEKQESEPVKKEIENAAKKLYDADEKSLVQGTLNLELETGGKPSADVAPVRRPHSQRSGPSAKERTSKLPSIKEALASKGFSAKKEPAALRGSGTILFYLNDTPLRLPLKKDGDSYYLMDMIEYSGIDLKQPKGRVTLSVNGQPGTFMQKLHERDIIRIVEEI